MIKKICFFVFFLSLPLFAAKWVDRAFETAGTGSFKDIRKAVETDYSFVKYRDQEKRTVLLYALERNRENKIIKFLLDSGSSPKEKDKTGKTALMYACQNEEDMDAVRTLIKYSAPFKFQKEKRILQKDDSGKNSFDYALENPKKDEVIAILSEYAKNPYAVEEDENPSEEEPVEAPMEEPAAEEQPAEVEMEAETSEPAAEVEIPDAASENLTKSDPPDENDMIEYYKMFLPQKDSGSDYLYDYAADDDKNQKIPEDLINSASSYNFIKDAEKSDKNGMTLLMKAAQQGDIERARDLIYSGANVNARDNEGWTALMYAARYQKNADVVKLLLNNGASPLAKNSYGANSAMLAAAYSKNPEIVKLLIAPFSPNSDDVREAFVYGIKASSSFENLKPFIDSGLRKDAPYNGKTYLTYARESNNNTDIINMLLP